MMILTLYFVAVGLLAFVPSTHATTCDGFTECIPDDYQEAYCCGIDDQDCCYYTDVVALWWFWLLLVFSVLFLGCCMSALCYRHRRSRVGYVVVRGETHAPTTIVHTQAEHVTSSHPAYTQYYGGAPPPSAGHKASAPPAYGYPSAYAHPPPMYQG